MINSKFKRIGSATALVLALAIGLLYLPASLAATAKGSAPSPFPQQATAVLTTGNNQSIIVNGASASSGATIMTGAMLETPDQIGASMSIPGHFTLDITPNAKLSVEFTANGIKVNLIKGCIVLHTKKGTTGEIARSNGVVGTADGSKDARLDVCDPSIATAPAAAAETGGLGQTGGVLIGAAAMGSSILIPILTGGDNPSRSAP
ncbi:MAG TPA: hypothetical protein VGO56_08225 [Pyrinomonadaceae bacterium]|jgi:hypothetical protein|nr:hypothetical protein [Pyrinomonadaceae bacterium]